jgi:hypothetical protein
VHWSVCVLLVLGVIGGLALDTAAYERPTTEPPTPADLVLILGQSKTLVVRLLNLTPYTLTQDYPAGITARGSTDKNRNVAKSFMFAPVGWPGIVPGLQGTWTQTTTTGAWIFTPSNTNRSTHPYNFVLTWDDHGGYVTDSMMGWTINNVYPVGHTAYTQDVPLRMWFTRVKPDDSLKSEVFRWVSAFIKEAVALIGVCVDPVNPIAWFDSFVATKELADTGFEAANSRETDGDKMYVAAYTIPDRTDCGANCLPETITESSSGMSTDAVDVDWGQATGDYSSQLVVTTQLFRGKDFVPYENTDQGFQDFRLPIMSVTLWTPEQYLYAKAKATVAATTHLLGQRLNTALGSPDPLSRFTQFAHLYHSLNPAQQRTLKEALNAFRLGDALTDRQVMLLERLAAALEAGWTTLHEEYPYPRDKEDKQWERKSANTRKEDQQWDRKSANTRAGSSPR